MAGSTLGPDPGTVDDRECADVSECRRLLDAAARLVRGGELRAGGEAATRAGELARVAHRPDLLAEAALVVIGVQDDVIDAAIEGMCRDALVGLGPSETSLRARVHGQLAVALAHRGRLGDAAASSEVALDLAAQADDPVAQRSALHARQMVVVGFGRPAELVDLGRRMVDLAATSPSSEAAMLGHAWQIDGFLQLADSSHAAHEIDSLDVLAARTGDPLVAWHACRARAGWCQAVGRLAEAERLAGVARDLLAPTEPRMALPLYFAQLALISIDTGRPPTQLAAMGPFAAGGSPVIRATIGRLELAIGDRAAARASLEAIRPMISDVPRDERWLPTLAAAVDLAVAFEDRTLADALRRELEPFDTLMIAGAIGATGPVAYFLGLVDVLEQRLDTAIGRFDAALELLGHGDFTPSLTRSRIALAEALVLRSAPGDRARAATLASIAAVDARRVAMAALLPRATNLVEALSRAPSHLSPREREIATHVAAGRSNREIGTSLVLSERTVEAHVRHIMTKLEFHSRSQIAAWAVEQRLTPFPT